jgi:hypothetical protein
VILAIIAAFVFYELPSINSAPAAAEPIHVTVEGHQYYWQFDYTDSADHARSIGTLHVPVGSVVDLKVVSPDVIHSWWVPALGGKIQRRASAPSSEKLMPPPPATATRGSNLRSSSSFPPRAAGGDASHQPPPHHHGRYGLPSPSRPVSYARAPPARTLPVCRRFYAVRLCS